MQFSKEVLALARNAAEGHPNDVGAATDALLAWVVKLDGYDALVGGLVYQALRTLVYDARAQMNKAQRRERALQSTARRIPLTSTQAEAACRGVFDYFIAGKTVGQLLGKELIPTALREERHAEARLFHGAFLRGLAAAGVPDEVRVCDALSEAKAQRVWTQAGGAPVAAATR